MKNISISKLKTLSVLSVSIIVILNFSCKAGSKSSEEPKAIILKSWYNFWDDGIFGTTLIIGSDSGFVDSLYNSHINTFPLNNFQNHDKSWKDSVIYAYFNNPPSDSLIASSYFSTQKQYFPPKIIKIINQSLKTPYNQLICRLKFKLSARQYVFTTYYGNNKSELYCLTNKDSAINTYIQLKSNLIKTNYYTENKAKCNQLLLNIKAIMNTSEFILSPNSKTLD